MNYQEYEKRERNWKRRGGCLVTNKFKANASRSSLYHWNTSTTFPFLVQLRRSGEEGNPFDWSEKWHCNEGPLIEKMKLHHLFLFFFFLLQYQTSNIGSIQFLLLREREGGQLDINGKGKAPLKWPKKITLYWPWFILCHVAPVWERLNYPQLHQS